MEALLISYLLISLWIGYVSYLNHFTFEENSLAKCKPSEVLTIRTMVLFFGLIICTASALLWPIALLFKDVRDNLFLLLGEPNKIKWEQLTAFTYQPKELLNSANKGIFYYNDNKVGKYTGREEVKMGYRSNVSAATPIIITPATYF